MNTNEHRIREFAYQIWESEGKPHGHANRHWEMACKLANAQTEGEGQLEEAIDSTDKIFLPGDNDAPAKKSRSKTKSNEAASLADTPTHATVGKPTKTKKPKSAEEISA